MKLKKEWQKKTYLEGRYATLGNAIGSIFSFRHILYPLGIDIANIYILSLKCKLLKENYV